MSDNAFPGAAPDAFPGGPGGGISAVADDTGSSGSGAASGVADDTSSSLWPEVNALIRDRLQQTAEVVPDTLLDPIDAVYAGWLLAQYPCLGSYGSLTGNDLANFNYALALMVAASARPWVSKSTASGDLIRYKQGMTEYQYSDPSRAQNLATKTTEQMWLDEAWLMLGQVSCIAASVAVTKAGFHLYAQNGPRRRQEVAGYVHLPGGNPLFALMVSDLFAWQDVWGIR